MISQEEASAIIESATDSEIQASTRLVILFCVLGLGVSEDDIPTHIKALSIETVRAISAVKIVDEDD